MVGFHHHRESNAQGFLPLDIQKEGDFKDQNRVPGLGPEEVSSVFMSGSANISTRQNFVICIPQHLNWMWSLNDRDTFFKLKMVNLKIFVKFIRKIKTRQKKSRNQKKKKKSCGGRRKGRERELMQAREKYSAKKMETFL